MVAAICDMSDLPVDQCACRLHGRPEPRGHAAQGGGRDGYPAAGVAPLLGTVQEIEITDVGFRGILTRVRAAGSGEQAVHELALFCADSAHWWESYRPQRAQWLAILTVAAADRVQARPTDVLALIEDAGPVPWEKPRTSWVADVDAIYERRHRHTDPRTDPTAMEPHESRLP